MDNTRPMKRPITAGITTMRMIVLFIALVNVAFAQTAPTLDYHGKYFLKTGELFSLRDHWTPPDLGKRVKSKAAYVADSSLKMLPAVAVVSDFTFETANKVRQIAFSASCRIETPGTYKFVRELSYDGADGTPYKLKQYWILVVASPILDPKLDAFYFPNEAAYFTFTAGHSDFERYSYEIYDSGNPSTPVITGKGPVVQLDSLTHRQGVVQFEEPSHRYVIKGMYDGRQFMFKRTAADTAAPALSEWTITVRKPQFQMLHTWMTEKEFDDTTQAYQLANALKLQSLAYANLCEFRCVYFSQKGNSYIYTPMNISDIKVESDKSFLESSEAYTAVPVGFYNLIEIKRNDSIRLPEAGVEVRLMMTFRTQFEQVTRRFKAIVY